jgi:hypothetical protein
MSNPVIIANELPREIVALDHVKLDEAMALCERAHAIAIPSPSLDEPGCRSALAEANRLYNQVNDLEKALEGGRLQVGREISALKAKVDEAVRAATVPLADQRDKLGKKIFGRDRELREMLADRQRKADEEKRRREAEARAAEEAARKAKEEADARARAAEAQGVDLPPPIEPLATAPTTYVRDAEPEPYIPPAPRSAVKARTEYSLRIDDLAKVPVAVAGVVLRKLDEAAALKLLRAGVEIPGLSLVTTEAVGAKGRGGAFSLG